MYIDTDEENLMTHKRVTKRKMLKLRNIPKYKSDMECINRISTEQNY